MHLVTINASLKCENHATSLFSDNMYDPNNAKAEANQRTLLKVVDGGHVLADHSFDHMNHNSNDSPRNAYTNVQQDMVRKLNMS